MKAQIEYNGSVVSSLSAGQTAIIPKEMEFVSDIVIRAVADVSLITFYIKNLGGQTLTLQTKADTTWAEFCNNQHEPTDELPFYYVSDIVYCAADLTTGENTGSGTRIEGVLPTDTITHGKAYFLTSFGGSN